MTTVKEPPNGPKPPSFFRSIVSKLKLPVAPVSSGTQHHTPLKSQISDRQSRENASRCQFTFADGRQCKMSSAQLCAHHTSKQKRGGQGAALKAPELEALCSDLTTTTNINRALAQTFLLMAQGRISRKDAVAFGYLSQLLLQSVSGVRAEYVASFGYRQWENRLKTSFAPHEDDDPEPSSGGGENLEHPVNGVVEPKKAVGITAFFRHEKDERPLAERIMGKPDYADILSRSLDMLDRKYDTTPEGRCEANKLALELELMKPAPTKPAKGFFGQTVDLMRRFRDADQQKSGGATVPPALDYYGHPIQTHVVPPPWADKQDASPLPRGTATPGCAHPNPSVSRSEPPTVPDQATCNSAPVAAAVPEAQRPVALSASGPADFVAPPSRRPRKPRSHVRAPGSAPHSELPSPFPISTTTAKHDSLGGPDADHHEGHRTDWYAPPSWSKTRPPDPCPSRKEKLQRKLRSMSNSAFRRLQHRNSRGF
ncbi:MAG TPA: hypothetical protein VNU44_19820 [Bryobacteraceae bacterium]|nr:hypothetical protein [Bryobacteraceae bacterium]